MKFLLKIAVFFALILISKFTRDDKEALEATAPPKNVSTVINDNKKQHEYVQTLLTDPGKEYIKLLSYNHL